MKKIMMQIPAELATAYPIKIGSNLLLHPDKWLPSNWRTKRLVIITDDNVNKFYGNELAKLLQPIKPCLLSFAAGEQSKNQQIMQQLTEEMLAQRYDRETLILALGGGVVGDMAGFIAAIYLRGITYLQIPTTLLAMVDSSVGGKTAINTSQGKNLLGAFWQPTTVVIDPNCLKTLSQTQIINGFIEALKMFMTHDLASFNYAVQHIEQILQQDLTVLEQIIERAIKVKVSIVSQDEKENHQRMTLNFGHTIGHALEKLTDYTMLHGYAVALGILVETKISQLMGFFSEAEYQIIKKLFLKLAISSQQLAKISPDELIQATKNDKKNKANHVRYVLLKKLGQVCNEDNTYAYPVVDEVVKKAFSEVVYVG